MHCSCEWLHSPMYVIILATIIHNIVTPGIITVIIYIHTLLFTRMQSLLLSLCLCQFVDFVSLYVYLSVSLHLPVCTSVYLSVSVCLSTCVSLCLSVLLTLSVCLCLSVCLFCLSVCLSINIYISVCACVQCVYDCVCTVRVSQYIIVSVHAYAIIYQLMNKT